MEKRSQGKLKNVFLHLCKNFIDFLITNEIGWKVKQKMNKSLVQIVFNIIFCQIPGTQNSNFGYVSFRKYYYQKNFIVEK